MLAKAGNVTRLRVGIMDKTLSGPKGTKDSRRPGKGTSTRR